MFKVLQLDLEFDIYIYIYSSRVCIPPDLAFNTYTIRMKSVSASCFVRKDKGVSTEI